MVRREVLELVREAWPRPDQRHVSPQHVEQLRKLVEARLAKPAADPVTASSRSSLNSPLAPGAASGARSSRCTRRVVVARPTLMVLNLRTAELAHPFPRRGWRKKTGPFESSLISSASDGEQTGAVAAAAARRRRGPCALDRARGARGTHRRKPDQRHAFHGVDVHLRSDHLEQPRHEVHLHARLPELADQGQVASCAIVREGEDHAIDVDVPDQLGELVQLRPHRQVLQV